MAEVLAERGYHNASIEEVAERLDMAKASLYYYFESKEALVYACLATCAKEVAERLSQVAHEAGTPTERLEGLVRSQITLITDEFPEMARLFLHPLDWPEPIRDAIEGWRAEHDRIFREVIEEGVLAGDFDAETSEVGRRLLHGGLNNVPEWAPAQGAAASAAIVEAAMRMFRRPVS